MDDSGTKELQICIWPIGWSRVAIQRKSMPHTGSVKGTPKLGAMAPSTTLCPQTQSHVRRVQWGTKYGSGRGPSFQGSPSLWNSYQTSKDYPEWYSLTCPKTRTFRSSCWRNYAPPPLLPTLPPPPPIIFNSWFNSFSGALFNFQGNENIDERVIHRPTRAETLGAVHMWRTQTLALSPRKYVR